MEVKSINTSFCKASSGSGIRISNSIADTDMDFNVSDINFSAFVNNTAEDIVINLSDGEYHFSFCNVLNNVHKRVTYGATFASGNAYSLVQNCSFLGNNGPGIEFFAEMAGIRVKNSYCDRWETSNDMANPAIFENVQNTSSIQNINSILNYECIRDSSRKSKKQSRRSYSFSSIFIIKK